MQTTNINSILPPGLCPSPKRKRAQTPLGLPLLPDHHGDHEELIAQDRGSTEEEENATNNQVCSSSSSSSNCFEFRRDGELQQQQRSPLATKWQNSSPPRTRTGMTPFRFTSFPASLPRLNNPDHHPSKSASLFSSTAHRHPSGHNSNVHNNNAGILSNQHNHLTEILNETATTACTTNDASFLSTSIDGSSCCGTNSRNDLLMNNHMYQANMVAASAHNVASPGGENRPAYPSFRDYRDHRRHDSYSCTSINLANSMTFDTLEGDNSSSAALEDSPVKARLNFNLLFDAEEEIGSGIRNSGSSILKHEFGAESTVSTFTDSSSSSSSSAVVMSTAVGSVGGCLSPIAVRPKSQAQQRQVKHPNRESIIRRPSKTRPMPDMTAFQTIDRVDSFPYVKQQHTATALCPPTPIKTPDYVIHPKHRTSLGGSKVLMKCLPDDTGNGSGSGNRTALSSSNNKKPYLLLDRTNSKGELIHEDEEDENDHIFIDRRLDSSHATATSIRVKCEDEISFLTDFENLGLLGRGTFADVYKARSLTDDRMYAIKRSRRQFRGCRDRERALQEVRVMQLSACDYVIEFYQAWQEDGYFFSQTELCSKHSCWNLLHRELGTNTILKIAHDVGAGLAHMHSVRIVHHDIKPSNILLKYESGSGCVKCKIADFGFAGEVGSSEEGAEGDTAYMPLELLSTSVKDASADMFSLGMTLLELSSSHQWRMPSQGKRWHDLRNVESLEDMKSFFPEKPHRPVEFQIIIQKLLCGNPKARLSAAELFRCQTVHEAGGRSDEFLVKYMNDVFRQEEKHDRDVAEAHRAAKVRSLTPTGHVQSLLYTSHHSLPDELTPPANSKLDPREERVWKNICNLT